MAQALHVQVHPLCCCHLISSGDYEDPDVSESSGVVSGSRSGDEGGQEEPSSQEEEEEEIDELQEESSSEAAEGAGASMSGTVIISHLGSRLPAVS